MKAISRAVCKRSKGWLVRVYFAGQDTISEFFSDGVYGGKTAALRVA
jgi:hypothetical protein